MEIRKFGFYFALGIIIVIGFKFLDTIEMFFPGNTERLCAGLPVQSRISDFS